VQKSFLIKESIFAGFASFLSQDEPLPTPQPRFARQSRGQKFIFPTPLFARLPEEKISCDDAVYNHSR